MYEINKLVITFHTTEEAIALEAICGKEGLSGRLIPVPRKLSANCGLAWEMDIGFKEKIEVCIGNHKLEFDGIYECTI